MIAAKLTIEHFVPIFTAPARLGANLLSRSFQFTGYVMLNMCTSGSMMVLALKEMENLAHLRDSVSAPRATMGVCKR